MYYDKVVSAHLYSLGRLGCCQQRVEKPFCRCSGQLAVTADTDDLHQQLAGVVMGAQVVTVLFRGEEADNSFYQTLAVQPLQIEG